MSVVVVDCSENDAHEDVETDDKVSHKIQGKPLALVVSRHPGEQNTYWLVRIHINIGILYLHAQNLEHYGCFFFNKCDSKTRTGIPSLRYKYM